MDVSIDFFAHSNYCELALIEMGERDVFPHVGRDTRVSIEGARHEVYPLVTGTFGGVDFLHSVTGEGMIAGSLMGRHALTRIVSDKLTQNEIEELEESLKHSAQADTSILRNLLDMIPDGIFGGKHQSDKLEEIQGNAATSQLQNMSVSPREPEEYTLYVKQVFDQIMPAIEWHDDVMKSISSTMENIPVLPKILDQLEEQISQFVFSIIAPFIVPVISQIRGELKTGSEEIIESSEREQHVVFHDDSSSDPTHSMLSKDHFSNVSFSFLFFSFYIPLRRMATDTARFSTRLPVVVLRTWSAGLFPKSWMPLMTNRPTSTAPSTASFTASCTTRPSATWEAMLVTVAKCYSALSRSGGQRRARLRTSTATSCPAEVCRKATTTRRVSTTPATDMAALASSR